MFTSIAAEMPQQLEVNLDKLTTDYFNFSVSRYVGVAGGCMAVYDHILSFPDEVSLSSPYLLETMTPIGFLPQLEVIWKAPFSTVNAIYIFNRISLPIILALHQYGMLLSASCHNRLWPQTSMQTMVALLQLLILSVFHPPIRFPTPHASVPSTVV